MFYDPLHPPPLRPMVLWSRVATCSSASCFYLIVSQSAAERLLSCKGREHDRTDARWILIEFFGCKCMRTTTEKY